MFEKKKSNNRSYFTRLNPVYRFQRVPETIIHQVHSGSSNLNRNSITVLSWNIAKNNYYPNWSKDFRAIIEQYRPDKIFLQEVCLRAEKPEIPELAKMGWAFAPNFIDTSNNTYSGILIATQADYEVSRRHRTSSQAIVTKHYEPLSDTPKVSLFTKYSLPNRADNLLTVNTHLINFVSLSKFQAQLQEMELIIKEHQGRIILAGDFNTWNKSRWLMLKQMAARLNLTPVSFTVKDTKKIKSFLFSLPLDYIFYRGFTQKPDTAKVIDNITSSDHNPLLVELC
jgi:endonuclease/exonuclease/phosphatase (EEP) superfamily protein YafD